MICPYCGANDDKVIDSRSTEAGAVIRRRRQCIKCEKRFTTYERVEQANRLMVIKKDGSRVPFNTDNIARGIAAACGKLAIPAEEKARIVGEVDEELHHEFEREVPSKVIGERVMARLRALDAVAYIRFASEHLGLASLEEVRRELDDLVARPREVKDQQGLFRG
jgi:transcriptional repressor NrdR